MRKWTSKEIGVPKEGKEWLDLGRRIIVFIGPEGSGKTTQALKLAEATGKPYISTGDTLRDLAENDHTTKYGEACRKMFAEHAYLDGGLLLEILALRFGEEDTTNGFVLDGGMRTVEETEDFQRILNLSGRGDLPITVMLLIISEGTSIERLVGETGRNRTDDTEHGVRTRLEKYFFKLEERLRLIAANWRLTPVNAEDPVEKTFLSLI